ncbi:MAG: thioredoxin domain-containing protein, partial [Propionicimonas sp.]
AVVTDDPLSDLARATWRMAPIGTAVLVGRSGTAGFGDRLKAEDGLVHVCRGTTCFAPTADLAELRTALWSRA